MLLLRWRTKARLAAAAAALLALCVPQMAVAADDFLEPERAFRFEARPVDAKTVEVGFVIAPGYYLYREQFKFVAEGATLGNAVIPAGKTKYDETFQKNVETYRGSVRIAVPVQAASGPFRLVTTSQGCADAGLCYPPMQSIATVSLSGFGGDGSVAVLGAGAAGQSTPPGATPSALSIGRKLSAAPPGATSPSLTATPSAGAGSGGEPAGVDAVLRSGSFWAVIGAFLVAGLLLSL
ncbi:MAG: protein-disulfide reductase DsbD N-terminal domain-containing protein, partial [Pseudomonadota bacterium]|nr:protein-disulfide reductase DsbD N-terminal domain-containing protein [Pseudomonadota bacterium]